MKFKSSKLFKVIAISLCLLMAEQQSGFAQIATQLDISGHLKTFSNSIFQDKFRPLHLRYLQYDNQANNIQVLLDKGNLKTLSNSFVEKSTQSLLKYFFVGVTLPNDTFWVNLRPDSPEDIIDPLLAETDIGKILLETDVQLKKDTASFTSPETPEGKEYWDKLYKKAGELFGSQNVTIPTLTRPWIVPGEIIIRQTNENAYIYKATLKVMLEEDYLKGSTVYNFEDTRLKELNAYASSVLREKIIPKLTQEVNTSKRYAALRQVYYSLILAQWFKERFANKGGLYSSLIDRNNLDGLTSKDPWSKETYFQQYQKSFKEGEYNFKVPITTPYGQVIRSYFSGGVDLMQTAPAINAGLALEGGKPQLPKAVSGSPKLQACGVTGPVAQLQVIAVASEAEAKPKPKPVVLSEPVPVAQEGQVSAAQAQRYQEEIDKGERERAQFEAELNKRFPGIQFASILRRSGPEEYYRVISMSGKEAFQGTRKEIIQQLYQKTGIAEPGIFSNVVEWMQAIQDRFLPKNLKAVNVFAGAPQVKNKSSKLTWLSIGLALIGLTARADITPDDQRLAGPLEGARVFLTQPVQSNDAGVQALSKKAQELFSSKDIKVRFVVTDIKEFLRKNPKFTKGAYVEEMLAKGSAQAMIISLGPNEYLMLYDESMMQAGISGLIYGLAHELIGHMTFTREELDGLSPMEEEALVFAREIKYLEALLQDKGLQKQFGGESSRIWQELKAGLENQKQVLAWIQEQIRLNKGNAQNGYSLSKGLILGGTAVGILLAAVLVLTLRKNQLARVAAAKEKLRSKATKGKTKKQRKEDTGYLNADKTNDVFSRLGRVGVALTPQNQGGINSLLDEFVSNGMLAPEVRNRLQVRMVSDADWIKVGLTSEDPAVCNGTTIFIRASVLNQGAIPLRQIILHEAVARHLGIRQQAATNDGNAQHLAAKDAELFDLRTQLLNETNPIARVALEEKIGRLEQDIAELETRAPPGKAPTEDRGYGGEQDSTVIVNPFELSPIVSALQLLGREEEVKKELTEKGVKFTRGPSAKGEQNTVFVDLDNPNPESIAHQIQNIVSVGFWRNIELEVKTTTPLKQAKKGTDLEIASSTAKFELAKEIENNLPATILNRLRKVSKDNGLTLDDFNGDIRMSFYRSSSNKLVFEVVFMRKHGSTSLAYKRAIYKTGITLEELGDQEFLSRLGLPFIPEFGWYFVDSTDQACYLEEFIPGDTAFERIKAGRLSLEHRREIVADILETGKQLPSGMPQDDHGKNFIIRDSDGRVMFVDIGTRRVPLYEIFNRPEQALWLINTLVGYFGYDTQSGKPNDFVFEEIQKAFPAEWYNLLRNAYIRGMGLLRANTFAPEAEPAQEADGEIHKRWIRSSADLAHVMQQLGIFLAKNKYTSAAIFSYPVNFYAPHLARRGINGRFVEVNARGLVVVKEKAIAEVLGIPENSSLVRRVGLIILAHELAEDAALASPSMTASAAHTEGMMAEAEAIGEDEELRQAIHKLWDSLNANRSAGATIEYGGLDAWGNMEEGYEGEGEATANKLDILGAPSAFGKWIKGLLKRASAKRNLSNMLDEAERAAVDPIVTKIMQEVPSDSVLSEQMIADILLANSPLSNVASKFGAKWFLDLVEFLKQHEDSMNAYNAYKVFSYKMSEKIMYQTALPGLIQLGKYSAEEGRRIGELLRRQAIQMEVDSVKAKLTPLLENLPLIQELLLNGTINTDELKQAITLSGPGGLKLTCNSIANLKDAIAKDKGLEGLLDLAKEQDKDASLYIKSIIPEDKLSLLVEYKDVLNKYGIKPALLLSRIFRSKKRGEETWNMNALLFNDPLKSALSFMRRNQEIIDKYGIELVIAFVAYQLKMSLPAAANAASVIKQFETNMPAYLTREMASNLGGPLRVDAYILKEYGVDNIAYLIEGSSLDATLSSILALKPLIQDIGIEPLVRLAKANKKGFRNISILSKIINDLDVDSWLELLIQQGKIRKEDSEATKQHLKNIIVLYQVDEFFGIEKSDNAVSLLRAMLKFQHKDTRLGFLEDFLLSAFSGPVSIGKIRNYLISQKSAVKRTLITRGLFWFYGKLFKVAGDGLSYVDWSSEWYLLLEKIVKNESQQNLANALNFIPTCDALVKQGILEQAEVSAALDSGDLVSAVAKLLKEKIAQVFNIDIKTMHPDAQAALSDNNFLADLFSFQRRYSNENAQAYEILRALLKAYFDEGAEGVIKYKASHELAKEQAPEGMILEQLANKFIALRQLQARASESEVAQENIFERFFKSKIESYDRHCAEMKFNPQEIGGVSREELTKWEEELANLAKSAQDVKLKDALERHDAVVLKSLKLSGKDNKIRNQAFGLMRRIEAARQENVISRSLEILKLIRQTGEGASSEQEAKLKELSQINAALISQLIPGLKAIYDELLRKNKPEAVIISEIIGILDALSEISSEESQDKDKITYTAEVSFDFSQTLQIGRHGNSGQGNCQNSNNPGIYNQSLMSFIGDAHELIILVHNASGEIAGFVLLHGVKSESGEFMYVRERLYTDDNSSAGIQELAVKKLIQKISNTMGVKIIEVRGPSIQKDQTEQDSEIVVNVLRSYVPRYLDSLGGTNAEYGGTRTLKGITIISPEKNISAGQNLGAQSSSINSEGMKRLRSLLGVAVNKTLGPDATDAQVIEFVLQQLEAVAQRLNISGLVTRSPPDADGNITVTIDENKVLQAISQAQAEGRSDDLDIKKLRLLRAALRRVVQSKDNVEAVNFQNNQGTWYIVGFSSQLANPENINHERQEINLRKRGLSANKAHELVRALEEGRLQEAGLESAIAEALASQTELVQQDEFGADMSAGGPAAPEKKASEEVVKQLKQEIAEKGRVTFERYMELCLYHPTGGYYTSTVKIATNAARGNADFITFPEQLHPHFGRAVAKQIVQMWENMGKPSTFDIVEQGAGNGTLCRDILEAIKELSPALFAILNYKIIEKSSFLINEKQRPTISEGVDGKEYLSKTQWISEEKLDNLQGIFLSNELPDAFAVHRVRFKDGRLQEAYVKMGSKFANGQGEIFEEEWGEISDPQIEEYLKEVCKLEGVATIEELLGGRNDFAVNLAAVSWYKNIAARLFKGYILTIDYGFPGTSLENMSVKINQEKIKQGHSIRTFNDHQMRPEDLYGLPGAVDITSDIYFPMLHTAGRGAGLKDEGYLRQSRFLKNLGVPSRLLESQSDPGFFVFMQSRGVEEKLLGGMKGSIDLNSLERDALDSLEPHPPVFISVKEVGPMNIQEEIPYEKFEQEVAEGVTTSSLSDRAPLLRDVISYLRIAAEKRFGSVSKASAYVQMRASLEKMDYPARKLIAEALVFAQERIRDQKDNQPLMGSNEEELAKAERIYEQLPDLIEELVYVQDRECWVVRFKNSSYEMPVDMSLPDAKIIELIRQQPTFDSRSLIEGIDGLVSSKYIELNISANYASLSKKKDRSLTLKFEKGRTVHLSFTPWATNQEIFEMAEAAINENAQLVEAEQHSPFGKANAEPVAKVGKDGKVHFAFVEGSGSEFVEWNKRHEDYHLRLDKDNPAASLAAKEIAAIALAFSGVTELTDNHLKALLLAFGQQDGRAPTLTEEEFLSAIADFLIEINPALRNQILADRANIIQEARNIVSGVIVAQKPSAPVTPSQVDKQFSDAQKAIAQGNYKAAQSRVEVALQLLAQADGEELGQIEVAVGVLEKLKAANLLKTDSLELLNQIKAGNKGQELKQAIGYKPTLLGKQVLNPELTAAIDALEKSGAHSINAITLLRALAKAGAINQNNLAQAEAFARIIESFGVDAEPIFNELIPFAQATIENQLGPTALNINLLTEIANKLQANGSTAVLAFRSLSALARAKVVTGGTLLQIESLLRNINKMIGLNREEAFRSVAALARAGVITRENIFKVESLILSIEAKFNTKASYEYRQLQSIAEDIREGRITPDTVFLEYLPVSGETIQAPKVDFWMDARGNTTIVLEPELKPAALAEGEQRVSAIGYRFGLNLEGRMGRTYFVKARYIDQEIPLQKLQQIQTKAYKVAACKYLADRSKGREQALWMELYHKLEAEVNTMIAELELIQKIEPDENIINANVNALRSLVTALQKKLTQRTIVFTDSKSQRIDLGVGIDKTGAIIQESQEPLPLRFNLKEEKLELDLAVAEIHPNLGEAIKRFNQSPQPEASNKKPSRRLAFEEEKPAPAQKKASRMVGFDGTKPATVAKVTQERFVYGEIIEFGSQPGQYQYVSDDKNIIQQNGTNVRCRRIDSQMAQNRGLPQDAIGKFAVEAGGLAQDVGKPVQEGEVQILDKAQLAAIPQMVMDALNAGQIQLPVRPAAWRISRALSGDTTTVTIGSKKIAITINPSFRSRDNPEELVHRGSREEPYVFINFSALDRFIINQNPEDEAVVEACIDRLVLHEISEMLAVLSGYSNQEAHEAGIAMEELLKKDLPPEIATEVERVLQPVLKEREEEQAKQAQGKIAPSSVVASAGRKISSNTEGRFSDVVVMLSGTSLETLSSEFQLISEFLKKRPNIQLRIMVNANVSPVVRSRIIKIAEENGSKTPLFFEYERAGKKRVWARNIFIFSEEGGVVQDIPGLEDPQGKIAAALGVDVSTRNVHGLQFRGGDLRATSEHLFIGWRTIIEQNLERMLTQGSLFKKWKEGFPEERYTSGGLLEESRAGGRPDAPLEFNNYLNAMEDIIQSFADLFGYRRDQVVLVGDVDDPEKPTPKYRNDAFDIVYQPMFDIDLFINYLGDNTVAVADLQSGLRALASQDIDLEAIRSGLLGQTRQLVEQMGLSPEEAGKMLADFERNVEQLTKDLTKLKNLKGDFSFLNAKEPPKDQYLFRLWSKNRSLAVTVAGLKEKGFKIVSIPYLHFEGVSFSNEMSYNNSLVEVSAEGKFVTMPNYGIPALDNAARAAFEAAGFKVTAFQGGFLWMLGDGTINCMTSELGRRAEVGVGEVRAPVKSLAKGLPEFKAALDEAQELAIEVNEALGGKAFARKSPGGEVKAAGQTFEIEIDSSGDISSVRFARVVRVGSLIFVVLNQGSSKVSAAEVAAEIKGLKEKLKSSKLYQKYNANIIFTTPTYYQTNPGNPISDYTVPVIAAMLANQEKFRGAAVFDLGAGDGLLARLALHLGAAKVILVENDPASIERARLLMAEDALGKDAQNSGRVVIIPRSLTEKEGQLQELLRAQEINGSPTVALINIGPHYDTETEKPNLSAVELAGELNTGFVINGGHFASLDQGEDADGREFDFRSVEDIKDEEAATEAEKELAKKDFSVSRAPTYGGMAVTLVANRNVSSSNVEQRPVSALETGGVVPSASLGDDSRQNAPGGIDFRGLPIVTQPMAIPSQALTAIKGKLASAGVPLANNKLDQEWQEIEAMLNGGIIPSLERIKEYIASSCKSKDCQERIDQALSGIADILRIEEERSSSTEVALKQLLVLLESDKGVSELELALTQIDVSPKEPVLIN